MKRIWIFFLIGIFGLSGCTSTINESNPKNSNQGESKESVSQVDISIEEQTREYTKQLSKDRETIDAVLMGKYYVLPCSLKEFLDNGWEEDKEDGVSKIDTVKLEPYTIINITFKNKKKSFEDIDARVELSLINDTSKPIEINNQTQVVRMEVDNFYLDSKDFVTKKGIYLNAKEDDVNKAFEDTPDFINNGFEAFLEDSKEITFISFEFDFSKKIVNKIALNSVKSRGYKIYKEPKEIEKETASYKKGCEKRSAKYLPDHYSELVSELKMDKFDPIDLFIEGKVTETLRTGDRKHSVKGATWSVHIIKDENGKEYALANNSALDSFMLKVGDTIQFWGDSRETIYMEKRENTDLPYLETTVINVNGKEKYNYYRKN